MTGARKTHQKKARPDGWDTLKGISSNDNIITKRKYWVKLKNSPRRTLRLFQKFYKQEITTFVN